MAVTQDGCRRRPLDEGAQRVGVAAGDAHHGVELPAGGARAVAGRLPGPAGGEPAGGARREVLP